MLMHIRLVLVVIASAVLLSACAVTTAPRRSYPTRPFNETLLSQVAVGMTPEVLTEMFGRPDTTYTMTFGKAVGEECEGVAYRYYAAKDPIYVFNDEWKKNTFYFHRTPSGALLLNHWSIEHRASAMGGR
jgi:hypothetical protein